MLKLEENPSQLFPEFCDISEIPGQWWVAHTKSRNEKALAWQLCKWSIPYFLPLRERVTARRGRKFKSLLPLFSGYLFFCGDESHRYRALTTNRIAHVIEVRDQKGLVRDLGQIHQAICRGEAIDPHPYLKQGHRCRVISGPLMGLEGFVVRKVNQVRLVLTIEMLGQAASVEIDADSLEPMD